MDNQDIKDMVYCDECKMLVGVKIITGTSADGEPKWEKKCVKCNSLLDED